MIHPFRPRKLAAIKIAFLKWSKSPSTSVSCLSLFQKYSNEKKHSSLQEERKEEEEEEEEEDYRIPTRQRLSSFSFQDAENKPVCEESFLSGTCPHPYCLLSHNIPCISEELEAWLQTTPCVMDFNRDMCNAIRFSSFLFLSPLFQSSHFLSFSFINKVILKVENIGGLSWKP